MYWLDFVTFWIVFPMTLSVEIEYQASGFSGRAQFFKESHRVVHEAAAKEASLFSLYWAMFYKQTFAKHMLNAFPHFIYLMGDVIENMIAKTDPRNQLQVKVVKALSPGVAQVVSEWNGNQETRHSRWQSRN